MAFGTLGGSQAVNDHRFVAEKLGLFVALVAGHQGMPSRQWQGSAPVVVECRRHPAFGGVTVIAVSLRILVELPRMHIHVTVFALCRRALEDRGVGAGLDHMAGAAGGRAVSPDQWEAGFRMIESLRIDPRPDVMASLAAQGRAIGAFLGHAVFEFAMVRIHVARGATLVFEMKRQFCVDPTLGPCLVALDAGNHRMRAFQRETRGLMHGDRKSRAAKINNGVAGFAAIQERSLCKLPVVGVLMAILALPKLNFEKRVCPSRLMALGAFHVGMFAEQGIRRDGMLLDPEQAGLPRVHGVAFGAFPFACAKQKLAFVRVGLVAIIAKAKGNRLVKIPSHVATVAAHFDVRAE